MQNVKETIAKDLLKIKAVFFRPEQPFTWASGIKSPVYCDNRLTLTAPEVRNDVENALAAVIKSETSTPCPSPFDTRSGWRAPMFCPAKVAMVF